MKIPMYFKATVIGCSSAPYNMENGRSGISYKLCVEANGMSDNLPCDETVFKAVDNGTIPKFTECNLFAEYDSRYKRIRVYNYQVK